MVWFALIIGIVFGIVMGIKNRSLKSGVTTGAIVSAAGILLSFLIVYSGLMGG